MEETTTVADSAPVADAAPSEAVEATGATAGDLSEAPTTTDANAPTDPDDDEAEEPDSPDLTAEEKQTKAQERRERRKANAEKRVADAVEARLTQERAAVKARADADAAEATARAAREAYVQRFGEYVGTPERRTALQQEINDLIEQTTGGGNLYEADAETVDKINAAREALVAKRGEVAKLDAQKRVFDDLDEFQVQLTIRTCEAQAARLPSEHQRAYLESTDMQTAFDRYDAGVVAREGAKHQAEMAAVKKQYEADLAKERTAHAATRTGIAGDGPAPNGTNGSGNGTHIYTRAELHRLLGSTEGMAEYRKNRAEIERQELAGLIR